MPRTKHEQGMAIDFASRGDQVRKFFEDLLGENASRFGELYNQFLFPQMQKLFGEGSPLDQPLAGLGSEGLSPQALAALTGRNIERANAGFDETKANLVTMLGRRGIFGGENPAAGDTARLFSTLYGMREQERAKGLRETTLADENQRYLNRVNLDLPMRGQELARRQQLLEALSGVVGSFGPLVSQMGPYVAGLGSGLDAYGAGVGARINARELEGMPGAWTRFGTAAVGAGGQAAGGYLGRG